MFCFIFICTTIKINNLYLLNSSVLHTLPTLTPEGYDIILSSACNLLSSLLINAILVISVCASLLNHCCSCNVGFSLNK